MRAMGMMTLVIAFSITGFVASMRGEGQWWRLEALRCAFVIGLYGFVIWYDRKALLLLEPEKPRPWMRPLSFALLALATGMIACAVLL